MCCIFVANNLIIIAMEKQKTHTSIWLIDNLSRFVFWFFAAVSAIFLVFLIIHLLGFGPKELDLSVEFPTNFKVYEKGTFTLGENVSAITISEASGTINFENAPRLVSVVIPLFVVPLLAALLYILWLFKGFTKNVRLGNAFDPVNIKHLKRMAYIIAGVWLYLQLTVTFYNLFIVQRFDFEGLQFTFKNGSFGSLLFIALFVWVLTHIFQKGAEMEEENRLTV